jgi:hypothetical protein
VLTSPEEFVRTLVADVPQLAPILEEHLVDNFGDLLPHVFMADVTRFVIQAVIDPRMKGKMRPILDHMNEALEKDDEPVQELVYVSFLENLLGEVATQELLIPLMKPTLASVARDMWR